MDETAAAGRESGTAAAGSEPGRDPAGDPARDPARDSADDPWSPVSALITPVMVAVPIVGFRVRDLLALRPGAIAASSWRGGREVPLSVGAVKFAWVEFEVSDGNLSARITRLCGE